MAKFCQNCGSPLGEGVRFCPSCGSPVPQAAQPQQPKSSPDPQPQRQADPQPYSYTPRPQVRIPEQFAQRNAARAQQQASAGRQPAQPQAYVYQQSAAIASFELSFQNLYRAISPARATLTIKEADLTYQEQVCAAAELKYKQGNISANSLQEAVNARESARRDVETARLDLFTAYHAYRQAVDKGLTGSGS